MSSGMSSLPTRSDRAAASSSSAPERPPLRRRMAYSCMWISDPWGETVRRHRMGAPIGPHRENCLSSEDAQAQGLGGGLAAALDAELAQDRRDVVADRALRQEEPLGDLAVAQPLGHQGQHLELARGQPGGVAAR